MEHLEGILKLTDNELGAIVQNGKYRNREEIHSIYELMDIAKDVYKIWCMENDMDGESYDGYANRGSYDGGNSYASGRGRNAKRDSMGRYSREGESYRGYRGYSREGEYIDQLRDMMSKAPDEQTRQSIQRMISQMEHG